jgi:aminopeptidase N
MFKILILLFAIGYTSIGFAQETHLHACAAAKIKSSNLPKKTTRGTTNDVALMAKYNVHNYALQLAAENNSLYVDGATTIGFTTVVNLDTFVVELSSAHTVDSIKYNGTNIPFTHAADIIQAFLPNIIPLYSTATITIFYHGTCPNTGASAIDFGFNTDTSPSWGNSVTWSLSQPYSAYQWFACKQALQDKADSSSVSIITSSTNKAGSNGKLISTETLPNGKVKYNWKSNYPIDYYLISVAIAQYVEYKIYAKPSSMPNDSILVQHFVYNNPGTLPQFKNQMDTVARMLEYFSDKISLYPFAAEKYGVCLAPFTGGMEHQTMTTEGFHEFTLNAHELFHQWFGDNVTCKTWSDIFVNEAFASYGEYLALEKFRSFAAAQADMAEVHSRVKTQLGGSIYFTDTTNARIFSSRLSYDKGAAVVHSLRFVLGDSVFFKTLGNYQNGFAKSTAGIQDFKTIAENTSGQNLTDFFDQWIYKEGYIKFNTEYTSNGNAIIIKIDHSGSVANNNLYKTPLQVKCKSASGDTSFTVNIYANTHTYYIPSTKIITAVQIDPNNWLLDSSITKVNNNLLLGLGNLKYDNFISIYPNPTQDIFTIKGNAFCAQYSVTNTAGSIILQGKHLPKTIHAQTWPKGIYTIVMQDVMGQRRVEKLVVQ